MGTYLQTTFARWKEKFLSLTKYPSFHFIYLFIYLSVLSPHEVEKKLRTRDILLGLKIHIFFSSDRSSDLA